MNTLTFNECVNRICLPYEEPLPFFIEPGNVTSSSYCSPSAGDFLKLCGDYLITGITRIATPVFCAYAGASMLVSECPECAVVTAPIGCVVGLLVGCVSGVVGMLRDSLASVFCCLASLATGVGQLGRQLC